MSGMPRRVVLLDGDADLGKAVLGGKGWGIQQMRRLRLPVPPAFALPVPECQRYHERSRRLEDETWQAVLEGLSWLEQATGRRLGDPSMPLLLAVRSGASVSMPGMMDTVLNVGMTDAVERGLAELSGDAAFARDTHARFSAQFGRIVLGADIETVPGPETDVDQLRSEVAADCGTAIPNDPLEQLGLAICAVFDSWYSRRATVYRRHWGIGEEGGTAVTVQVMVFGNLAEDSGTGVFFTRDPRSGAHRPYGEWLPGGQGEDVVSGTHTVQSLDALAAQLPEVHEELVQAGRTLEREHADIQDIEFTVERGGLYLLQTRSAKRSPAAAVRAAVEFADAGIIDRTAALRRVRAEQVASLLRPRLAPGADTRPAVAHGEGACAGVGAGIAVGDSETAVAAAAEGRDVILVRPTTSPEDIAGMIAARAIVTHVGGSTSHAAVCARALGRPCVVGVGAENADWLGHEITVDGATGQIHLGRLPLVETRAEDHSAMSRLLEWACTASPVQVVEGRVEAVRDLDETGIGLDPQEPPDVSHLVAALKGSESVRGAVLATPVGAEAVLEAGVPTVVVGAGQHALVILLQLLQAETRRNEREGVAA